MNDDQFDIVDEPHERKRKSKFRPLGIPWRWVLAAFAAGAGLVLLFLIPSSLRQAPNDAMVVEPTLPPPTLIPSAPASPTPLPDGFHLPHEYVEDVAWHNDMMAAATMSRLGLYQDLSYLKNVDVYEFENATRDKYIDLAFNVDGTEIAAIQSKYWFENGELMPAAYVSMWNADGAHTREFMAHSGNNGGYTTPYLGVALAYSPDGLLLATGAGKGEIILWETRDYQPVSYIYTSSTGTIDLAFSDDGERLTALLRSDDGTSDTNWADSGSIQVWDIRDPRFPSQEPFTKDLQRDIGLNAAISPNGQFAAYATLLEESLCCRIKSLQIWDVFVDQLVVEIPLDEGIINIQNLSFSADSDTIAFTQLRFVSLPDNSGTVETDLRVFGWQKEMDNPYRLQDLGGQLDIDTMPYNLHINRDGTWVQYITTPYNFAERWYIATGQVQDMSL
jgi:hypothetical protein